MRSFFVITIFSLLTACSAPSPAPTDTVAIPPTVSVTETATLPPEQVDVEINGYLDDLDFIFQSPVTEVQFGGSEGPKILASTAVEESGRVHGINTVEMPPKLLVETTARALHAMLMPEEEDTPENVQAFAEKWAEVQAGDSPCSDLMREVKLFYANGNGVEQIVSMVPACGLSPVPDGAIEVKEVKLIYGAWYVPDLDLGKNVADPDAPWFKVVIAGAGFGTVYDEKTQTLNLFIGANFLTDSTNSEGKAATYTQALIDSLGRYQLGRNVVVKSSQNWANESTDLINAGFDVH